jgi:transcriptional regulator with XRE-family HTH domain
MFMGQLPLLGLADRTLQRIRQLVEERGFSHEALAPHLAVGPSAVSKLLSGKNAIGLDHIEGFCFALQITPAELMAEPGALIQPISPTESALLREFRTLTETQRLGLLSVLERATEKPHKGRRARLGRVALTSVQQELVDLFVLSNEQARDGVLKILRGAARSAQREKQTTG